MSSITIRGNTYEDVKTIEYVDKLKVSHDIEHFILNEVEVWTKPEKYTVLYEEQRTMALGAATPISAYVSISVSSTGEFVFGESTTYDRVDTYIKEKAYEVYPIIYNMFDEFYYKINGGDTSFTSSTDLYAQKCVIVEN